MECALLSAFQCIEKLWLCLSKLVVAQDSYSSWFGLCVFQKQIKILLSILNTDVFLNVLWLYGLFVSGFSNLNGEQKNPDVGNAETYV